MRKTVLLLTAMTFVITSITSGFQSYASTNTTFSDIGGHWAEGEIEAAVDYGYIDGYPDGTFQPERSITRAEFVKIINAAKQYTDTASIPFNDVPDNKWYYPDIQKAYQAAYVQGDESGFFRPDANISRQEAAVILDRLTQGGNADFDISDVLDADSIASWALNAVIKAFSLGFISGDDKKMFHPADSMKRCEAVKIINRVLGLNVGSDSGATQLSVLKVGDRYITQALLDEYTVFMLYLYSLSQMFDFDSNVDDLVIEETKLNVLDMMAETEALRLYYKDLPDKIPGLSEELAGFKEMLFDVAGTAASFEKYGVTDASFIYYLETNYLHEVNMAEATNNGAYPSETDIVSFYNENISLFSVPETRKSSHIIFEDMEHKQDTKALAENTRRQIINGAVSFEDMAAKYNTDSTKNTGGDLGFASRGDFVQEFEDVLFSMKVNDISEVVETQFGYHIIKLTAIESAKTADLAEVREDISSYLAGLREGEYSKGILAATAVEYLSGLYPPPELRYYDY